MMKKFNLVFLILLAMSSVAFAQTEEKTEAYKFFEFGKISKSLLKEKMSAFLDEVNKDNSVGYIINYGKPKQVSNREKEIRKNILFRNFDASRITLVNGGDKGEFKTELWIVPPGAEPPKP